MVGLGLTTWAESPEPTRSDSHAWSAHPNFDLLRIVAGIRPKSAGFEEVVIEPHLGELTEVKAGMPIPQGTVEGEYKRAAVGVGARVKLPAGGEGGVRMKGEGSVFSAGGEAGEVPCRGRARVGAV